jgi:hypothetical protein
MKNYYFTFGQSHQQIDGTPMHNYWIRVEANDFMSARLLFINKFSSIYMPAPDKWAFQYEEDGNNKFNPEYFPLGEYCCIRM